MQSSSCVFQGRALSISRPVGCKIHRSSLPPLGAMKQPSNQGILGRRSMFSFGGGILTSWVVFAPSSNADILKDFTKQLIRPDIDFSTALVMMLDARGVLLELQRAAAAPEDSGERQKFNAYLPGIAKRLRDVAQAAPAVAASLLSSDKDETVSNAYGGTGDVESGRGLVDPVFMGVGKVLSPSGRGIRKQALISTDITEDAIVAINSLLDKVPEKSISAAQEYRQSRK